MPVDSARTCRSKVLALSLQHSVLSSQTSFFAVEKRLAGARPSGPAPVAQALAAAAVDPLPYVAWTGDEPPQEPAPSNAQAISLLTSSAVITAHENGEGDDDNDLDMPAAGESSAPDSSAAHLPSSSTGAGSRAALKSSAAAFPTSFDQPFVPRAKIIPSRSSAPRVFTSGKQHGGLGTPVAVASTHRGGAAYPRASRKQRHLLATEGCIVRLYADGACALLPLTNCRPSTSSATAALLPPRVTPFGVLAYPAPAALSDSLATWVLRGPLNVGGTCWLDAAVSLLLLLAPLRTAVLHAPPYLEPPSSPTYSPSPVLVPLQTLLRYWLSNDNRTQDFHAKSAPLVEKLWRSLGELGLRYSENQSAATVVDILLTHLGARGLAPRTFAVGHCKGASLSCQLELNFKPEFIVLIRSYVVVIIISSFRYRHSPPSLSFSDAPALDFAAAAACWPNHHIYAFIAFRRLQVVRATEINHFITICLSNEADKYDHEFFGCFHPRLTHILLIDLGVVVTLWLMTCCSSVREAGKAASSLAATLYMRASY